MRHLLVSIAALMIAVQSLAAQSLPAQHLGFDRNLYPGDTALPALRKHFVFTGYWLNNPPGETTNTWRGKRAVLLKNDFGFLVLFNGREDAQILRFKRRGTTPEALGKQDAATAIAAAQRESFPADTVIFLDQEEGGRLLDEQSAYLFAWTEAIAASTYKPGVYLSGQPADDGPGKTITTAQNVRELISAKHFHAVALFAYQDTCPPSNGCTVMPPPISSAGTPDIAVWQYAQSPRRPENTKACLKTYASDNNCYAPGVPGIYLDMNVATSDDPSHGR
jgi:hypothetical protein